MTNTPDTTLPPPAPVREPAAIISGFDKGDMLATIDGSDTDPQTGVSATLGSITADRRSAYDKQLDPTRGESGF